MWVNGNFNKTELHQVGNQVWSPTQSTDTLTIPILLNNIIILPFSQNEDLLNELQGTIPDDFSFYVILNMKHTFVSKYFF